MFKLIQIRLNMLLKKRPSAVTQQPPTDETSINQKHIIYICGCISLTLICHN